MPILWVYHKNKGKLIDMGKKYVKIKGIDAEREKKGKIIAIMNNKGGCGKTSTAIALGMYLARTGHNILFWDGDPQSNMTQRMGIQDDVVIPRINTLLHNPEDTENITQIMEYPFLQRVAGCKQSVGKIGLMPGDHASEAEATYLSTRFEDYKHATERLTGYANIESYMQSIFDEKKKYFDYVIMDTAPAMQGNTLNLVALRIADEIICPIDSLEAMSGIDEIIGWMEGQVRRRSVMPNGLFAMVKYQADTKDFSYGAEIGIRNAVFRSLRKVLKNFMCEHGVKELRSMRLSKKSIPGFGGKTEYTALCKEITEKIHESNRQNMFDFFETNGVLHSLENEISTLSKIVVKRKPHRKIPKYVISKKGETDISGTHGDEETV